MQPQLLHAGFTLMLYGMGMVFIFLSLLYILTTLMSRLIRTMFKTDLAAAAVVNDNEQLFAEHVSVITAAIQSYRKKYFIQ